MHHIQSLSYNQKRCFYRILSEAEVPAKTVLQINVVVDEILSNIIYYSGATSVKAGCASANNQVILQFTDNGCPYDPREKADPDISLPLEEREIGGLGIFMVKKIMDEISYEYKDGQNILTLFKR